MQSHVNPYLQQEVLSASPSRLRWLLIKRAEELCGVVSQMWADDQVDQADQWLLRIREILGELLGGVQDASHPVGKTVADFYVFLLQLVSEVEQKRCPDRLATLRELLGIELETWQQVLDQGGSQSASPLETPPRNPGVAAPAPLMPISRSGSSSENELGGSFSLEV